MELKAIAYVLSEAARPGGQSPEEEYCTEEERALLPLLVSRVRDHRQRKAIELVCLEKMTVGEISRLWGIHESRVSRILSKGVSALKAMLDSPPPPPEL